MGVSLYPVCAVIHESTFYSTMSSPEEQITRKRMMAEKRAEQARLKQEKSWSTECPCSFNVYFTLGMIGFFVFWGSILLKLYLGKLLKYNNYNVTWDNTWDSAITNIEITGIDITAQVN